MELGPRIKETRLNRGITLRKLAKDIGVSPSFISQVEQGKAQPSIDSLKHIAQVLSVNCSYLIGEETGVEIEAKPQAVKNKFNPEKLNNISIKKMVPENMDNNLEPSLLVLNPGAQSAEDMSSQKGEEFLLVLSGQMEINLNEQKYTLNEGENIYFNSAVKYNFKNTSTEPAKVLWIKAS